MYTLLTIIARNKIGRKEYDYNERIREHYEKAKENESEYKKENEYNFDVIKHIKSFANQNGFKAPINVILGTIFAY